MLQRVLDFIAFWITGASDVYRRQFQRQFNRYDNERKTVSTLSAPLPKQPRIC